MRTALLGCVLTVLVAAGADARPNLPGDFDPETYFAGRTRSSGVMENPLDGSKTRFTGETRGRRERDGSTVFDQEIRFEDGTVRRRNFRLVRTGPNTIEATGSEVVGVAKGEIHGRELRLLSTIRSEPDNPFSDVDFDQTMTLRADGRTVDNMSVVTKLGFAVRRLDESFRRGR